MHYGCDRILSRPFGLKSEKYNDNIEVILAEHKNVWKYISARMKWKQELLTICVKVSKNELVLITCLLPISNK